MFRVSRSSLHFNCKIWRLASSNTTTIIATTSTTTTTTTITTIAAPFSPIYSLANCGAAPRFMDINCLDRGLVKLCRFMNTYYPPIYRYIHWNHPCVPSLNCIQVIIFLFQVWMKINSRKNIDLLFLIIIPFNVYERRCSYPLHLHFTC